MAAVGGMARKFPSASAGWWLATTLGAQAELDAALPIRLYRGVEVNPFERYRVPDAVGGVR